MSQLVADSRECEFINFVKSKFSSIFYNLFTLPQSTLLFFWKVLFKINSLLPIISIIKHFLSCFLSDDTLSEKDCSSLKSGETPKEKEVFYKMESTEETRMESDVAGTCSPSKSCDLSVTHSEAPQVKMLNADFFQFIRIQLCRKD